MIRTILVLIVMLPMSSFANMNVYKSFKTAYPDFKAVSCTVCHLAGGSKLNPYGLDLQKNKLDFKAIESLDSDGDGTSNIDEIKAGKMPGDKDK